LVNLFIANDYAEPPETSQGEKEALDAGRRKEEREELFR
jgi:hypothetical protein